MFRRYLRLAALPMAKRRQKKENLDHHFSVVVGMAKREFIPPTLEEVKAYIIEAGCLKVDAGEFITYYATNDWRDSNNKPLKVWKLKIRYWQSMASEMGRPDRKCHCGKYASYIGKDDTGQVYFRCEAHKPIRKFALPKDMTANVLHDVNKAIEDDTDLRRRRNQAIQLQGEALRRTK